MANSKSRKDLEELIALYKEEKYELESSISRSRDRIKELNDKIDAAYKEMNGQLDLFEGLT